MIQIDLPFTADIQVAIAAVGPVSTICSDSDALVDSEIGDGTPAIVTLPESLKWLIVCDVSLYPKLLPDGPATTSPVLREPPDFQPGLDGLVFRVRPMSAGNESAAVE